MGTEGSLEVLATLEVGDSGNRLEMRGFFPVCRENEIKQTRISTQSIKVRIWVSTMGAAMVFKFSTNSVKPDFQTPRLQLTDQDTKRKRGRKGVRVCG